MSTAREPATAHQLDAFVPVGRPLESTALSDLTDRQYEIAQLVAKGMTNKEIAAALVIGRRTVDTHVAHILAKLGVSRRSEVANLVGAAGADARDLRRA
ncbi:response regulator transcription factor [Mycolicibacterium alvei]|uniref:response regulator transcription factor n=1 Tax=Mycolicibacterium alvei TaxID=67081 RepID=UPI0013D5E98A|nr:helix-turn-helix transcriptional regulator [Mycolicibacterium alvei]MCV7003901.1 helix-turn-helix transcriptional regulator [Mycolicibacterium alvei]